MRHDLGVAIDDAGGREWLNDDSGIWEYQLGPLTTSLLAKALDEVAVADLPVEFEYYDGTGWRPLRAVHIDVKGAGGVPTSLVVTVASLQST